MTLRNRLLAPLTAALVGGLVAMLLALAPAAPAAAGTPADGAGHKRGPDAVFKRSSYLCYGYQDCRQAGMGNAGYARANSKMYWRMYSGHNCTNYAAYRMVRSGLPNQRPWSGGGNATYWGTSMPKITDATPRVGAVAWWKANTGPAGSAGHVAYVEKVVSADEIIVSQDSWGGDFSWAVVTRASGNWPSGFVHFNDVPLTNRVAPEISGIAKVGSVLSSTSGTWKPADADVAYQWYADGVAITGATEPTLRLTRARLDQVITVTTTGSKLGYPTRSATSAPTDAVLPGTLKSVTAPAISGEAKVDSTLTLDTGTWTPTPSGLAVQWFSDGTPIEGAVDTSLPVTPDLVGATISATVTATRDGYDAVSASSAPTQPVAAGTFTVTTPPSVDGIAKLGQTLTVDTGAFRPTDADVAIQWLRDGEPVPNATGSTYQISNVDLGSRISARVTLTRAGYTDSVVVSDPTARVKTDPQLRVRVRHLDHRHGVRLTISVDAPGLETVTGPVVVRVAGVARELTLRNGKAHVVLTDLPTGKRPMVVRYGGSDTVTRTKLSRQIRIR